MRVLHILRATGVAGAERHVLALLAGLRASGLDAQLALLTARQTPLPGFQAQLQDSGVPFHAFAMRGHVDLTLLQRLRALIRKQRPHVVHTHLFHADLYGALAARTEGVPALVSSRHNDNAFRRRLPWRALNRLLWRRVDAGIAISQAVADFVVEVEGAPRDKLRVIHYGLKQTATLNAERQQLRRQLRGELGLDDAQPVIAMACRLVEQKGVSDALQAFAGTRAEFPQARLLVAGDGPLRARLQKEAVLAGPGGSVRFLGWREDVPELLAACDVFLMPSLWEGFGLVLLEAMARGLPVVASRVSAIPEVVEHGETGLLAPAGDVPAFCDALLTLLRDPAMARHMGERGRHRLETCFGEERMVQDTHAFYQDLLPTS